jgi:Zn-dependent protease
MSFAHTQPPSTDGRLLLAAGEREHPESNPVFGPGSALAAGLETVSAAPDDEAQKQRGPLRRTAGAATATVVAAAKWGALLLSKFKFATVLVSMLVSVAAYTLLWGWTFAVGFVLLLLIHEYGHVLALRREGVHATAPVFIPFLGAVVGMREMPKNAVAEAKVGLAGPVAGTLASLVVLAIYGITGVEFWRALAYAGFFLQLFNLAPVLPLDGGRAMAAVSTRIWLLGWIATLAAALLVTVVASLDRAIILYLIVLLGGRELLRRRRQRRTAASAEYHQVAPRTRLLIGLTYLVLLLGTGAATVSLYLHETVSDASHHTLTQG